MAPLLLRQFKINEIVNWTALRFAEETEAWDSVERLLAGGAAERDLVAMRRKLQSAEDAGRVASEMCRRGCQRLLRFALAERPSLVEAHLPQQRTLLHDAAEAGSVVAVRCLVEAGANVNARDQRGLTPLHEAAAHCSYYVLLLLLKAGADASATDEGGRTALHYAARGGSVCGIQVLMSEGLRADTASVSGWTPLHEAAGGPNPQCVFLLIEAGADKLATTAAGWTALHTAASSGTTRAVRILLDAGIPVDARTLEEETALHFAAERGADEIVTTLAEAGAHLEAVDKSGRTPSRRAAERHLKEQVAVAKAISERQLQHSEDDTAPEDLESEQEKAPGNMTADLQRSTHSLSTEIAEKATSVSPQIVPRDDSELSYGDNVSEYSCLSGESDSSSCSDDDEISSVDTASEKFKSYENLPSSTMEMENPHANYQKHPHSLRGKYRGRGRGNFRVSRSGSRDMSLEHSEGKGHHQPLTKHHSHHHRETDSSSGNNHRKHRRHNQHKRQQQQQQQQPHQQQQAHYQQYQKPQQQPNQQQPQQHQHKKKPFKQQGNQQTGYNNPKTDIKPHNSGDYGMQMEFRIPQLEGFGVMSNPFSQNRQTQGNEQTVQPQFARTNVNTRNPQNKAGRSAQNQSQESNVPSSLVDELERLRVRLNSIAPTPLLKDNQKKY